MTTRRVKIVDEVARRLRVSLNEPVKRGYTNIPVTVFPSIYVFEDEESVVLAKPGLYRKELPLVIERFLKIPSGSESYVWGNSKMHEMIEAIEIDERLTEGFTLGDKVDPSKELAIGYSMRSNVLVEMAEGVLDVVIEYVIDYVDSFLGYQGARH